MSFDTENWLLFNSIITSQQPKFLFTFQPQTLNIMWLEIIFLAICQSPTGFSTLVCLPYVHNAGRNMFQ